MKILVYISFILNLFIGGFLIYEKHKANKNKNLIALKEEVSTKKPMCFEALDKIDKSQTEKINSSVTKNGVQSGKINPNSKIGCYAGDEESYELFSPIFDYIVKNYHHIDLEILNSKESEEKSIKYNFSSNALKLIKSTRIRFARNFSKYPFPSALTLEQRLSLEKEIIKVFSDEKFLQGKYTSLKDLKNEEREKLIKDHLLFKDLDKDKYLLASGIANDFPLGRGIYISKDKKKIIWLGEEDHLRIISMQENGDIKSVYENLKILTNEINKQIPFAKHNKYGYLSSCPTNIGTGMRASVHIKLENLGKKNNLLKALADEMKLDVRGVDGEHSQSPDMIFDISNKERLGKSPEEYINNLIKGINILAEINDLV